ncbi:MAG: hypothetical protein WD114_06690 [Phycisphaerales bacterium]
MPTRRRHILPVFASVLAACLLTGCQSKQLIKGRVIAGPVGQSVVVSPQDERFDDPGIPAAIVSVIGKDGANARARGVYATAETDASGNFELVFPGGTYPRDAVEIRVKGEGIYTSRSQTFLPPDGDALLCVVITRPGYVIPDQNRDAPE